MNRSGLKAGALSLARGSTFKTRGGQLSRAQANGVGVPRRAISPASPEQRAKAQEGCRVHGHSCGHADAAHVIDRSLGGCDDALCTVPLCRMLHRSYDEGGFDLLPYLSLAEQAHAAGHLGLLRATRRVTNERLVA